MSFNLHSRSNRRIYPKEKYPLTHWIDRRNEFFRRDKPKPLRDTNDFDLFVFLCFGFLLWIVFNFSIHFYNVSYGPFHFTLSEFVREIENFDRQSFIWRKIYFQVEFDENKSLNSSTWITLPMKNIKSVHHRFPLDFHSFSNSTLRCFIEKISKENLSEISADSIRFIDKIYQRSRTKFTHSILSDCGIFIGFIYKTMSQNIVSCFIPSRFRSDYFLSQTKAFCCLEFFFCFSLFCYIWMLLTPFIDLTHFLLDWVSSLLYRYGIYSYPLEFCDDIQKELSILNLNLSLTEQILVLDRSIQQAEFRWENLLFVIQIDEKNRYVVMLHEDLDRLLYSFWATSPFKICHVDQIEEIYFHEGIFWGNNHSWISWTFNPNRFTENHAYWLHSILMEISDVYRQRFVFKETIHRICILLAFSLLFSFCSFISDTKILSNGKDLQFGLTTMRKNFLSKQMMIREHPHRHNSSNDFVKIISMKRKFVTNKFMGRFLVLSTPVLLETFSRSSFFEIFTSIYAVFYGLSENGIIFVGPLEFSNSRTPYRKKFDLTICNFGCMAFRVNLNIYMKNCLCIQFCRESLPLSNDTNRSSTRSRIVEKSSKY